MPGGLPPARGRAEGNGYRCFGFRRRRRPAEEDGGMWAGHARRISVCCFFLSLEEGCPGFPIRILTAGTKAETEALD